MYSIAIALKRIYWGYLKKGDDAFILAGFDNWKDLIYIPCLIPTKKLF